MEHLRIRCMPLFTYFSLSLPFFLNKEAQEITLMLQGWWGGWWATQNCWAWTNTFTLVFLNVSGSAAWIKFPGQSEGPWCISNTLDFSFLSMKIMWMVKWKPTLQRIKITTEQACIRVEQAAELNSCSVLHEEILLLGIQERRKWWIMFRMPWHS